MKLAFLRCLAAIAFMNVPVAQASLLGDTATCSVQATACSPASAVITEPGSEFTIANAGITLLDIDIAASRFTLTVANEVGGFGSSFQVALQSLDDSAGPITGIANVTSSNLFAETAQFNFQPTAVFVNLGGVALAGPGDGVISFDIVTTPIPEPSSMALLAAGLGLVGVTLRRRSKTKPDQA
jgi:hypothetical protein